MIIEHKMKTGMVSVAALAAGSGVAVAQDWTGPYIGLSISSNSGTSPAQPYVDDTDGYTISTDAVGGAFAGLRWEAAGNIVMGIEVAMQGAIDADAEDEASDPYDLVGLTDVKISVGTAAGQALIYGFAGMSAVNLEAYGDTNYLSSGANFGVGVEYQVRDNFAVGLEATRRVMNGYASGGAPEPHQPFDTVSLRGSFRF